MQIFCFFVCSYCFDIYIFWLFISLLLSLLINYFTPMDSLTLFLLPLFWFDIWYCSINLLRFFSVFIQIKSRCSFRPTVTSTFISNAFWLFKSKLRSQKIRENTVEKFANFLPLRYCLWAPTVPRLRRRNTWRFSTSSSIRSTSLQIRYILFDRPYILYDNRFSKYQYIGELFTHYIFLWGYYEVTMLRLKLFLR